MIKHRRASIIAGLLLCLSFILPMASAETAAPGAETVRVGFFAYDGYHMQDADGRRSGYGYDLIQYMSEYTDLQFDFVEYEADWSESLDLLENGTIDMLTSVQQTPERKERFGFSSLPIGVSAAILTVKAGNTTYILGDYAGWNGMRVGLLEGNSRNERFAEFALEKGFSYLPVYFRDIDDMLAALNETGSIDAMFTSNLRHTQGEWILAQFDPSPYYIIVRKSDASLLSKIDEALQRLYADKPDVNTILMSKYYLSSSGENIALSIEEQAAIEASRRKPITVGIITSAEPVCYFNEESGQFVGISMEILKAISSKTGLNFNYVPIDLTRNSPIGWLKAGEFDLVAGIIKSQTFVDDAELVLSDALMSDSLTMIGRLGDDFTQKPATKTIAILSGFQVGRDYVQTQFPAHNYKSFGSFADCLSAVRKNKADATVYTRVCSSYSLQNPYYEALEVIPAFSKDITTCIAGLSSDKQMLMSVIDKGLAMIDDSQRTAIVMNYTIMNPYRMSLKDTIFKYRVPLTIIIALLIAVIVTFALMLTQKQRSGKKLTSAYEQAKEALAQAEAVADKLRRQIMLTQQWQEASETDELTGLLNRRGGEQRIRSLLELGECGLFCLFDIDNFKSVNDNYGHETGDAALEAVAQCMRTFRGSDIQMRFGGDEFIVFAVGISNEEQAIACASKFLDAVSAISIAGMEGTKLSMSLGMHLCAKDERPDFNELYKLADAAMYQCKHSEIKFRFG